MKDIKPMRAAIALSPTVDTSNNWGELLGTATTTQERDFYSHHILYQWTQEDWDKVRWEDLIDLVDWMGESQKYARDSEQECLFQFVLIHQDHLTYVIDSRGSEGYGLSLGITVAGGA